MPHNISYTNIASILFKEINIVRNDPKSLIPMLRERINKYDQYGNYYPLTGLNFSVLTKEGIKGVENLITFLENQRQCANLQWSYELHRAADKRCHFLSVVQEKNVLNRVANLQVGELVSQFTSWKGNLVELTFYGFIEPREFLCELLLQDGKQAKENRAEIFSRHLCFLGIGINTHEKYRFVIVLIMATQVEKHEPFIMYRKFQEEEQSNQLLPQEYQHEQNIPSSTELDCNLSDCSIY